MCRDWGGRKQEFCLSNGGSRRAKWVHRPHPTPLANTPSPDQMLLPQQPSDHVRKIKIHHFSSICNSRISL